MLAQLQNLHSLSIEDVEGHLQSAGEEVLRRIQLNVFGHPCRILEVEFYFFGGQHRDPFAHCHEVQREFGHWYLHRVGTGFRNGSFKGIDLTFGQDTSFGGMLIRSLLDADGSVVCGPSLCVDHLIARSTVGHVRQLNELIGRRSALDTRNPIHLAERTATATDLEREKVFRSARVGLSTARIPADAQPQLFLDREYRFLREPKKIKKGRPLLIRALHRSGHSSDEIRAITGSPAKSIAKYST